MVHHFPTSPSKKCIKRLQKHRPLVIPGGYHTLPGFYCYILYPLTNYMIHDVADIIFCETSFVDHLSVTRRSLLTQLDIYLILHHSSFLFFPTKTLICATVKSNPWHPRQNSQVTMGFHSSRHGLWRLDDLDVVWVPLEEPPSWIYEISKWL